MDLLACRANWPDSNDSVLAARRLADPAATQLQFTMTAKIASNREAWRRSWSKRRRKEDARERREEGRGQGRRNKNSSCGTTCALQARFLERPPPTTSTPRAAELDGPCP
ncbi:unnamed protein product [Prorocentrum cordatum]|uniref:Uncharacterized protein n=1 Tax=Prorocentrum cordatum TaxID=2364126 RepID=A0ABN9UQS3_9DINO|nr:unnamed protein product [Polarella glacialis]